MILTEYDEKKHFRTLFREGKEEGIKEGIEKGLEVGFRKGQEEHLWKQIQDRKSTRLNSSHP